jgi:hypothetical protein
MRHHDIDMVAPSVPGRHALNRRTLDILVPIVYVLAVLVAILLGDAGGVGGVVVIGAVCVGAYYATLRDSLSRRS